MTAYSDWLESVSLLTTEAESQLFASLGDDLERERFLETFWSRRGTGLRVRFFSNRWAAQDARYRSPEMEWVASLTGQPAETLTLDACGPFRRRVQMWTFTPWQVQNQAGEATAGEGEPEGAVVVFVQELRADPRTFRLWSSNSPNRPILSGAGGRAAELSGAARRGLGGGEAGLLLGGWHQPKRRRPAGEGSLGSPRPAKPPGTFRLAGPAGRAAVFLLPGPLRRRGAQRRPAGAVLP